MSKKLSFAYIDFSPFHGNGDAIWLSEDGTTFIQRAIPYTSKLFRFQLAPDELKKIQSILRVIPSKSLETHNAKAIAGHVTVKFGYRNSEGEWRSFGVIEDDWQNQSEGIRNFHEIAQMLLKPTDSIKKPLSMATFKPGQLKLEQPTGIDVQEMENMLW